MIDEFLISFVKHIEHWLIIKLSSIFIHLPSYHISSNISNLHTHDILHIECEHLARHLVEYHIEIDCDSICSLTVTHIHQHVRGHRQLSEFVQLCHRQETYYQSAEKREKST
jgi:hypothetical protein